MLKIENLTSVDDKPILKGISLTSNRQGPCHHGPNVPGKHLVARAGRARVISHRRNRELPWPESSE